jgi:iron complex outermembrane receptor protein
MRSTSIRVIAPVTTAVTAALYPGPAPIAQQADDAHTLDEIIVTASKRSSSVQEIPSAVQAITQEALSAMGAKTMEDYSRFLPSVNVVTYGGNSSTVVFRGAITGSSYIGQSTSSVYLDEISITQTGSQPTIRAVDIARVEALAGPQGTLYGSDAQAGTMRIITNQPVMNTFEAVFDGEVRSGDESDLSYRGSLVFNIPLMEDRLALRIVGFQDRDGGFIDNVFGRTADWHGLTDRDGDGVIDNRAPAGFGTLDNAAVVDENWNEYEVQGGRMHLRWEMNDRWAATASYHFQDSEEGAGNVMDPFVGDLQVVRFHDDFREEKFNMSSLQLDGDMGFAQLVAAVSYYERESDVTFDATTYVHYWTAAYCHDTAYTLADYPYYWANPDTGNIVWWPVYCTGATVDADVYNASRVLSNDDKLAVEIRLQNEGELFDWIVGAYYEDSKDSYFNPFAIPTTGGRDVLGADNLYGDSVSQQFWEWYWSKDFSDTAAGWVDGSDTDWEQRAIFGEATWHINDHLDLTLGGRYFDRSNTNYYYVNHPGRVYYFEGEPAEGDDREYRLANGLRPPGRTGEEQQFIPKISLSYQLDRDRMVYGLYTQGKRQGGVNRSRGEPFFPNTYESDLMNNYEVGYKSYFADGKGRFNLTAYYMLWEDYQLQAVDPSVTPCIDPDTDLPDPSISVPGVCGQPWQATIANLGEAHIQGVNVELDYSPNENWMFGLNFEDMEAETDTAHDLDGDGVPNLTKGMRLPLVPAYKASAWIEYRQPTRLLGATEMFVRTQWSTAADSLNRLEPLSPVDEPNAQFENPGYTIGDLRAGIVGEDWQFDVFVNNLTDERAWYTIGSGQYLWAAAQTVEGRAHHQNVFVNRPTEFGVRYMKRWGD